MNDYFTSITKNFIVDSHTQFQDQSHASRIPTNSNLRKRFSFRATNDQEVKLILEKINPNKAPGYDLIPPRAVKASAPSLSKPLSDLINTIISRSEVPDEWKHGQITPLHKKDSVLDKSNFRPVTVLPAFDKVFERIIQTQMSEYFETILHDFTFAYRNFHGCPAALLTLSEEWKEELDKRKVVSAAALDLSKAFD